MGSVKSVNSHASNRNVPSLTGSRIGSNIHSSNNSLVSNISRAHSKDSGPPKFIQDLIPDHRHRMDRFNEKNKGLYTLQFYNDGINLKVVDLLRKGPMLTIDNSVDANTFFANINHENFDFNHYLQKKDTGTLHFTSPETISSLVARFDDIVKIKHWFVDYNYSHMSVLLMTDITCRILIELYDVCWCYHACIVQMWFNVTEVKLMVPRSLTSLYDCGWRLYQWWNDVDEDEMMIMIIKQCASSSSSSFFIIIITIFIIFLIIIVIYLVSSSYYHLGITSNF